MLVEQLTPARLAAQYVPAAQWCPFPPAAARAAWKSLLQPAINQQRQAWLVGQAEVLLKEPWPALPATLYMEFARIGNRERYETPYFERRRRLGVLVLAECAEGRGRFLDGIINGLTYILEEHSWSLPAHAARHAGDPLPREDVQSVDLFACETAMILAEAEYLLRAELAAATPSLVARLRAAILARVVVPVETRDDINWFDGWNNWTPWCASNTVGAALYLLDDAPRLAALLARLAPPMDRWLGRYGEDGGCDEGPMYWGVAGGALLLFLEHLQSRFPGACSAYEDPKIANIGRFIARTRATGDWLVNFADAGARGALRAAVIFRYGERVHAPELCDLALLSLRQYHADGPITPLWSNFGTGMFLHDSLRTWCWVPATLPPANLPRERCVWLPDVQVLVARESTVDDRGLVLAAKAGHNGESHNHNDLGHFCLYYNGAAVIADAGRETYTRQTFSPQRYDLWFTRGSAHNAPVVNGVEQVAGGDRRAEDVSCTRAADGTVTLAMKISAAYPAAAGLASLQRTLRLVSTPGAAALTVTDVCQFARTPAEVEYNLLAASAAVVQGPGVIVIGTGSSAVRLEFDPAQFQVAITERPLSDPTICASWGTMLWHLHLRATPATRTWQNTFTLRGA